MRVVRIASEPGESKDLWDQYREFTYSQLGESKDLHQFGEFTYKAKVMERKTSAGNFICL